MTYEEAAAQKEKIYGRIKEVRALLADRADAGERPRQTERLRILRDMYRDACQQADALRPPQERRRKAPQRRTIHTGGVGFDFFERCGTAWADINGTTWSELGQQAQEATARQADFLLQALRRAMATLTPTQAEVIMARYRDGLSLAEIARRRDCQRSTVCRVAKQALKKLERGVLAALQARECAEAEGFDFLRFAEATDVLTERQREYLYYLLSDGVTMEEIARHMGLRRSTLCRGNQQIAERLAAVAPSLPALPPSRRTRREDWEGREPGEIAAMLGISPAVYYRLDCRGETVGGLPRLAYEVLRLGDLPAAEAARRLGLSPETVRAYRRKYGGVDVAGLPEPKPYVPARRHPRQADLRGLLSRGREAGNTIGDSVDARTYQKMLEVSRGAPMT